MVGTKSVKIVFVSSGQYPDGGAATNRHMAYAKGLCELGHEVHFILLGKQKWQGRNRIIDGIHFNNAYKHGPVILPKINNRIEYLKSIAQGRVILRKICSEKSLAVLVLLDVNIISLIPFLVEGRRLNLKIFHERTEYPKVVSSKSVFGKINLTLYLNYVIKKFDGIYVINHALLKYFNGITKGKVPLKIINMIVDPSRFNCKDVIKRKVDRIITFCGSLDGQKDGVPILVESFHNITHDFPEVKLQLIGSLNNKETKSKLISLVNDLGIQEKVLFTGLLEREVIPAYLCQSDILALARPNNKQAEGGFPTKLGEYLATGNPVVVTDTGEICNFLKDGKNAFIAQPDSVESFTNKLRQVLKHENPNPIGKEGKKLVLNEFNYLKQAEELMQFFIKTSNEEYHN